MHNLRHNTKSRHERTREPHEPGSQHLYKELWTFCQKSNKTATNHTFLEQIEHVEMRNLKISNVLFQMYTFWSISSPTFS